MVPEGASLIIAAGGMSTRMGKGIKKELADLDGEPVLCRTLRPFFETKLFSLVVIVLPLPRIDQTQKLISSCFPSVKEGTVICIPGGKTRQESVFKGLQHLNTLPRTLLAPVLIHDGARPWVSTDVILRVYEKTVQTGAAVPVVPSVNALKEIDSGGRVIRNLDRSMIVGAQTPQGFMCKDILDAHRKAADDGREYLDDGEVFSAYAGTVFTVPGDIRNKKITYREDLKKGPGTKDPVQKTGRTDMRIGSGWDIHQLVAGRPLILGGTVIPFPKGEKAHSDGDVLIHALIDALFGALSLGDIGTHFPPHDPAYKDISSTVLLEKAVSIIHAAGYFVSNIDSTIILEKPKLQRYIPEMVQKLSSLMGITPDTISIKAKTGEGLGPVGEGKAVEARAAVLLEKKEESVWV